VPQKKKPSAERRIFVLDTNVLMHDPSAIYRFEEHDVFIPMIVLEELDAGKRGMSEGARNVRQVARFLDELMANATKEQIDRGLELPPSNYTNGGKRPPSGRLFFQTRQLATTCPGMAPTTRSSPTRSPCDASSPRLA
jgi:PhoH-like ATPase